MIFDKIFGKKDKPEPAAKKQELHYHDIRNWAEGEKSDIVASAVDRSRPYSEDIMSAIESLEEHISTFETQEIEEDVVKRLETITLTSKTKYCESMKRVLGHIGTPDIQDFEDIERYVDSVQDLMRNIERVHTQNGKYLGITFESTLKTIGQDVRSIVNPLAKLTEIEDTYRPRYNALETVMDLMAGMDSPAVTQNDIDNLVLEKRKVEDQLEKARTDVSEYKNSGPYREYLEKEEHIQMLEKQKKELNATIYDEIAPIKRILKKYLKALEDSKVSGVPTSSVSDYIEYPVVSLQKDDDSLSLLSRIVEGTIDAVGSGIITEKKGKISKLHDIKTIIPKKLTSQKEAYDTLCASISSERDEIDTIDISRLSSMERIIKDMLFSLEAANERIEEAKDLMKFENEKKKEKKQEIKRKIEKYWENVTLNL